MTRAVEEIATDNHSPPASAGMFNRGRAPAAPPTAQIIALPDLHPETVDVAAPAIVQDWNPLHHIKATLQVCVGAASITVGELLAAKEHQVLCLDRSMDQPVDLTIEGRVVARGQLVAVDGYFAVRITELPTVLGLTNGG